MLNFHYDPLACAVAVGWPGARVERMRLRVAMQGPVLRLLRSAVGKPVRVVVDVDGEAFARTWFSAVRDACGRPR